MTDMCHSGHTATNVRVKDQTHTASQISTDESDSRISTSTAEKPPNLPTPVSQAAVDIDSALADVADMTGLADMTDLSDRRAVANSGARK